MRCLSIRELILRIDTNHIPQVVFSEVQAVVVHRATVGYLAENDLQV